MATKRLGTSERQILVLSAAAILRVVLFLVTPGLIDLLGRRAEIATPLNAPNRLREGIFLYESGLDPYDGGVCHQAPLLLTLFSLLPHGRSLLQRLPTAFLYTALDLSSASNIAAIAASGAATQGSKFTSPRKSRAWQAESIAAIFLFNPFILLSSLAQTTTPFTTFFILASLRYACEADVAKSAFALAFASYLGLHPILLLPATILLCHDQAVRVRKPSAKLFTSIAQFVGCFTAFAALLLGLSRALLPSWKFLASVYITPLTLPDLTPNPGLWWYFFIEMFDAFREFFLGVFWLHMLAYSIPLCLRMRKTPLAAAIGMTGVIAVFQPYANIGDAGTWLSGLSVFGHLLQVSSSHRYTFPAMATLLYAGLLGPAFHYLWIYAGSGNANFFYAITLVWSLALLVLLADFVYAVLRDQWEAERPEGTQKEVRQI